MTEDLLGPLADKLAPEFVTPVVTYLAHEECSVSGEVYSVAGGKVSRVFVGVTPGFVDSELSAESVRANPAQIRAEDGYTVPTRTEERRVGKKSDHTGGSRCSRH